MDAMSAEKKKSVSKYGREKLNFKIIISSDRTRL